MLYICAFLLGHLGLPHVSEGKESACNDGNLGWILRLGRSLEEGMATHSSILAWGIPWMEEPDSSSPWGCKESDTTE